MDALTKILNDIDCRAKPALEYGYYAELSTSTNLADFKQRIDNIVRRLGFSEFTFRRLNDVNKFPPELSTIPTQLVTKYYLEKLYENDMSLQRAKESTQPFFQSTIHDYLSSAPFSSSMTRCMLAISELNKSFGYYDYYITPIRSPLKQIEQTSQISQISQIEGRCAVLTVTQRGLSPVEMKSAVQGCESAIRLLGEAIDFVATKYFPDLFRSSDTNRCNSVSINPKPLRVLDTLANSDLTINDVASKLSISVVTANQHLKTVRNALGVRTNYAAIKQAMLANLIEFKSHQQLK